MSQLFRSTDAGASWQTVDFRQIQASHESRVFYTEDPNTRYCLRVDPVIGSRIETVQCMTREEWADLDVNVDAEWAQNGVKVIA